MAQLPKEKAEELIKQFENISILKDYGGMDSVLAKQCTIIAVDEILNVLFLPLEIDYWEKVKKGINNL